MIKSYLHDCCYCGCNCNIYYKDPMCCFITLIIITGTICFLFHFILIFVINLSFSKIEEIKNMLNGETPIYDLSFDDIKKNNLNYIESFYEWQGRVRSIEGMSTESIIEVPKNISKIYQNYFLFKNDSRNYFDYLKDFSVEKDEECKTNYKKCGILNTDGRILCLPNEENCPLNSFAISTINNDPNYLGYQSYKVTDFISGDEYYFYYTNTKINEKIITNFKLSYGLPCMLETERSWISILSLEKEENPTCKTEINGKLRDDRYIQVNGGIISLKSLYFDNDIGKEETITEDMTVELYTRNFVNINEKCYYQFLEDIEKENDYFKVINIIIKVLSSIISVLLFSLIIYFILKCKSCILQIYKTFIIVPIIGIILTILEFILSFIKKRIKYECSDEAYNTKINNIINNDYSQGHLKFLFLGIPSLIVLVLNLIFCICLFKIKLKNKSTDYEQRIEPIKVNVVSQNTQYPQHSPNKNEMGQIQSIYNQHNRGNNLGYNNLKKKNLGYRQKAFIYSSRSSEVKMNNYQFPSSE